MIAKAINGSSELGILARWMGKPKFGQMDGKLMLKIKRKVRFALKADSLKRLLVPILLALVLFNFFIVSSTYIYASHKIAEKEEALKPAKLSLIEIVDSSCDYCNRNIDSLINFLKQINTSITSRVIEYNSAEAAQLIGKYGASKIPILIFSGEVNKTQQLSTLFSQAGSAVGDNIIINNLPPPYLNLTSNKIEGLVSLINIIAPSCTACYNVSMHESILNYTYGVLIADEKTFDYKSTQGKELVIKYNITKVPTIILSPESAVYSGLMGVWPQVGTIESDGWLVFRSVDVMAQYGEYINITSTP